MRRLIVAAAVPLFALSASPRTPEAYAGLRATVDSMSIHQEVDFTATPARLYQALVDGKEFAAFSGMPAEIDPKVGGKCSLFGAHIEAVNKELVPNQLVVQSWRSAAWPAGAWSTVRFALKAQGTGTHLTFDQTGFPAGEHDHLAQGWESNYWSKLKAYLK
jgi:activator of HSP90 ATPase